MNELLVYAVRYADGYEEVRLVPEEEVAGGGGVAAFESDLRETATWFYPVGKVKSRPNGRGGLLLPVKPIAALMKAWEQSGSPKIMGMSAGASPFEAMQHDDD